MNRTKLDNYHFVIQPTDDHTSRDFSKAGSHDVNAYPYTFYWMAPLQGLNLRATSMALQPCTPSTKKCDLRSGYKSTHCRQVGIPLNCEQNFLYHSLTFLRGWSWLYPFMSVICCNDEPATRNEKVDMGCFRTCICKDIAATKDKVLRYLLTRDLKNTKNKQRTQRWISIAISMEKLQHTKVFREGYSLLIFCYKKSLLIFRYKKSHNILQCLALNPFPLFNNN